MILIARFPLALLFTQFLALELQPQSASDLFSCVVFVENRRFSRVMSLHDFVRNMSPDKRVFTLFRGAIYRLTTGCDEYFRSGNDDLVPDGVLPSHLSVVRIDLEVRFRLLLPSFLRFPFSF